jgi:hypothetical protein
MKQYMALILLRATTGWKNLAQGSWVAARRPLLCLQRDAGDSGRDIDPLDALDTERLQRDRVPKAAQKWRQFRSPRFSNWLVVY